MTELREVDVSAVARWDRLPIRFRVAERVDLGRIALNVPSPAVPTVAVEGGWDKDYDANPAGHPRTWLKREDLSQWGFLHALWEQQVVGAAAIQRDLPGPDGVVHRATLWDIRVAPEHRGRGVGRCLFEGVCGWARARGLTELLVETQDNNVAANRFYAAMGCRLGQVNLGVYADFPDEAQLVWFRELS